MKPARTGKVSAAFLLTLAILAAGTFLVVHTYRLIEDRSEAIDAHWAEVKPHLEERYAHLPEVMSLADGMEGGERLRKELEGGWRRWEAAATVEQKAQAAQQLENGIERLFRRGEEVEDWADNAAFQDLRMELESPDAEIRYILRDYNDTVALYNGVIQRFPSNIVAILSEHHKRYASVDPEPDVTVVDSELEERLPEET